MKHVNGIPKFKTRHIEPLWSSKLDNLEALKLHMQSSTLVAFDVEFSGVSISELGLAMLKTISHVTLSAVVASTMKMMCKHLLSSFPADLQRTLSTNDMVGLSRLSMNSKSLQ